MRACNRCFKSFPLDNISTVVTDLSDTYNDMVISENIVNDNDHDENKILNKDKLSVSSDDSIIDEGNDIQNVMDAHAVFSEQDPTLNQTLDNQDNNAAFSPQTLATAQEMLNMMSVKMQLLVTSYSIRSEHVQEDVTGTLKVQVDKST